ncbi:MAG: HU family DNA-binding protein [Dermatophilaceae bacterium]
MNKAELVNAIESKLGGRKTATDALEAVLDVIIREVAKGGKVAITGFGTFQKVAREARTGRNPRTGETVRIRKTTVPRFRPGTSFKNIVADPRKLPKTSPAAARASAGAATKAGVPAKKTATTAKRTTAAKTTATKAAPAKTTAKKTAKATVAKTAPAKKASTAKTAAKTTTTAKRTAKKATS